MEIKMAGVFGLRQIVRQLPERADLFQNLIHISGYEKKSLNGWLRFLISPVPWQHLYRQTLGKKHTVALPAKWSLLAIENDSFDPLTFSPEEMTQVLESDHTTWADPFLWTHEGRIHLFYEDWPQESPCGQLYVVELDRSGRNLSAPQRIIHGGVLLSVKSLKSQQAG